MDVPNHLCFRALEADSLWLGWYCIRLTSRSHPPPSVRPSRSKPSWVSRLGRRCCWALQATMSHLSVSSLRLKVHSWLSLQQGIGLMPIWVWAKVLCVQSAVFCLCQSMQCMCSVQAKTRHKTSNLSSLTLMLCNPIKCRTEAFCDAVRELELDSTREQSQSFLSECCSNPPVHRGCHEQRYVCRHHYLRWGCQVMHTTTLQCCFLLCMSTMLSHDNANTDAAD